MSNMFYSRHTDGIATMASLICVGRIFDLAIECLRIPASTHAEKDYRGYSTFSLTFRTC